MDEVNVVFLAFGRCVDACCLLLDLLIRTFSWLLHFLSGVAASLHSVLVALSGSTLVEYWNFALFSFLSTTEAVSDAARGALQVVDGWLQTLWGVFESFKMVGHLSCHVAWRIRDVLHRGLLSGSCILRQMCEGLGIGLSLALYFVNTVVNIVLISTQNCASVLAGVWEVVAEPVHRVLELALTLLTFLYSCLVGASVLLWTPCQLLLNFLGALGRVFCTVATVDLHGLLIAAAAASLAFLLLNLRLPVLVRWLSRRLVNTLPGARGPQTMLERERALPDQEAPATTAQEVSAARLPHTDASIAQTDSPNRPDPLQLRAQRDGESASSNGAASRSKSSGTDGDGPPTDARLLNLLKEQEERKKCVICQDLSKTVLLLPCRHLCLCRSCADILSRRRHVQQRCCPLCRQPITQTMDVFL